MAEPLALGANWRALIQVFGASTPKPTRILTNFPEVLRNQHQGDPGGSPLIANVGRHADRENG